MRRWVTLAVWRVWAHSRDRQQCSLSVRLSIRPGRRSQRILTTRLSLRGHRQPQQVQESVWNPAEWLSPDQAVQCWCASAWVQVKHRWLLAVTRRKLGCRRASSAAAGRTTWPRPRRALPQHWRLGELRRLRHSNRSPGRVSTPKTPTSAMWPRLDRSGGRTMS